MNKYIIYHKEYPVVSVELNDNYSIEKIVKIHSKERLPVGLFKNQLNISDLNDWLFGRGIPAKRRDLFLILESNKKKNRQELIVKNHGMGLIDYYWIKKENDKKTWKKLNFFNNKFDQTAEDIYLGDYSIDNEVIKKDNDIIHTPNNVSSGALPKKWVKENGKLYLIKGSELQNLQEPFNEVIVSKYLDLLNIDHVNYDLFWYKKNPYSKCLNMLNDGEELIHAYYVSELSIKDNKVSYFEHYINCCCELGLDNSIRSDLENMIIIDYIIANTDRHWSNFGIIRDAETLKAVRLAPIYDNGASFFAKIASINIPGVNKDLKCQSFNSKQEKNLKLVKNFDLLKNKNINCVLDLLNDGFDSKFMPDERKKEIIFRIKQRLKSVKKK